MPSWVWIIIVVLLIAVLAYRLTTRGRDAGAAGDAPPMTGHVRAAHDQATLSSTAGLEAATSPISEVARVESLSTESDSSPFSTESVPAGGEADAETPGRYRLGQSEGVEPEPAPAPDPEPAADREPTADPEPDPTPVADGAYGPGSAAPTADGAAPEGYPVSANADSMLFSERDSPGYHRSAADAYFVDAAAAEAAGFLRWEAHRS